MEKQPCSFFNDVIGPVMRGPSSSHVAGAARIADPVVGGTVRECVDAASVALQNITGLACDPVGNRVEVPCLGKAKTGQRLWEK